MSQNGGKLVNSRPVNTQSANYNGQSEAQARERQTRHLPLSPDFWGLNLIGKRR